jgi:hypothetical protein
MMRKSFGILLACLTVCLTGSALAKGGHGGGNGHGKANSGKHKSTYAEGVQRDSKGRIARSSEAKREFMRMTGHPNGWSGHVVDHVVPLKRGGQDTPSNMQWQTIAEGKAKDRIE